MAAIFSHQLRYLASPADIALGISADGNCASVLSGLLTAREQGCSRSRWWAATAARSRPARPSTTCW